MYHDDHELADFLDGIAMGYFVVLVLSALFFVGKALALGAWHLCRWLFPRLLRLAVRLKDWAKPRIKGQCRRWAAQLRAQGKESVPVKPI